MDMIASSQTKRFLKICQVNDVVEDEIKKNCITKWTCCSTL